MSDYKFGVLEFNILGDTPIFFKMSDALIEKISKLPKEELAKANDDSWKLKRQSERLMKKYSNVTQHGHRPYDEAYFSYLVATAIMRETWKHMRKGD